MEESIDKRFGEGTTGKLKAHKLDDKTLEEIRLLNNPENAPTGHYTGRCMYCHSNDLWDDATAYGCNFCDAIYMTGSLPPKIVMNDGAPETPEVKAHNAMAETLARKMG